MKKKVSRNKIKCALYYTPKCVLVIVCPPTGMHFLPHPSDCSKFIGCNYGVATVVQCAEGLHFNPDTWWCDLPENVNCTVATSTITIKGRSLEDGLVTQCPQANKEQVTFLTHSEDCTIFYMCNWGIPLEMKCPDGLHFNATLNVCDWPTNTNCNSLMDLPAESLTDGARESIAFAESTTYRIPESTTDSLLQTTTDWITEATTSSALEFTTDLISETTSD